MEVQFPNLSWDETGQPMFCWKDGRNGTTIGKLDAHIPEEGQNGAFTGSFCGASGRFVVVGNHAVAAYLLPSGKLLQPNPAADLEDASSDDSYSPAVACSADGTRVAILDGTRLNVSRSEISAIRNRRLVYFAGCAAAAS